LAAPALTAATAGHTQVTLEWSAADGATGYNVYYDQSGKAQFVADAGNTTTYVDTGLDNEQEYCYKVTAYDAACESGYSNILCATPQTQGQAGPLAGVDTMEIGYETGKGKLTTWEDPPIPVGETVLIRVLVLDTAADPPAPISNATVEIQLGGPEVVTLNSGPSDNQGWAEATWNTQAPNKKGQGGTATGVYTATTTNVTASGYNWDGVLTQATFEVQ
jgi:hypothetical protein